MTFIRREIFFVVLWHARSSKCAVPDVSADLIIVGRLSSPSLSQSGRFRPLMDTRGLQGGRVTEGPEKIIAIVVFKMRKHFGRVLENV